MTIRDIAIAFGYEIDKSSESAAENSIQGLKDKATTLLGAIGIGFSLIEMNQLMEEFDAYNNKIKSATQGMGEQEEIQQKILQAANETKTSYGETAKMVSNLVQENSELFGTVDEAIEFNNAATKLFKTAGKTNEEIAGLMESINNSFAKGYVDSETISQLLEQAPESAKLLNKELGTTTDQLEELATSGSMSVENLKNAFVSNAAVIDSEFGTLNYTISDAILNIRNKWGLFLADINDSLGITDTLGRLMVRAFDLVLAALKKLQTWLEKISNAVGGFDNLLKILAITAGTIFISMNAGKILTFLRSASGLVSKINIKMLAIVAVVVLLALLIEDFFAFLSGENSLIGSMLEKAGVDVEALRQFFLQLFDAVKQIIPIIVDFAKQIGGTVLSAIKQLLPHISKLITSLLPVFVDLLETIIPFLMEIGSALIPVILRLLNTLVPILLQIIEQILPIIIELINALLPIITQIISAVLPVMLQLIQAILPLVIQIIETVLPVILDLITAILPVLQPIFQIISDLVNAVLPVIISLLNAILPILEPILGVLQPIADVLNVIIGAISKVVEWVGQGLGWIVDLFTGGGGGGEEAVNISGYASGTDYTPDTFIAGEEGPELITGSKGKKVFTALQTGDIFSNLNALSRSAQVQPSAISSASSTKIINQTNNINNNFQGGDRAAQKQGAAAMEKTAGDATSQMARGLAYAR